MSQFKRPGGFGGGKRKFGSGGRDFDRPKFGSGRPSDFKRDRNNDGRRTEMFSAVCADCGKRCEIPFKPSGDRPVFCSDCFRNKNDFSGGDFSRREAPAARFNKPNFSPAPSQAQPKVDDKRIDELKAKLDSMAEKINRLLQLVEKPVIEMPVVTAAPAVIKAIDSKAKKAAPKKKAVSKKK